MQLVPGSATASAFQALVQGVQLIRVQSASLATTWHWRSVSDSTNDEFIEGDYDADGHEEDQQNKPDGALSPYFEARHADNPDDDPNSAGKPREHEQDRNPAQQPFTDLLPHGPHVMPPTGTASAHRHERMGSAATMGE